MYNKKVLRDAMKNLDRTVAPAKRKDMIVDPMGQWKYPGQNTRIPSNDITMQGVPYPVWAVPNVGTPQMMYPGQDYYFPGADHVDEYPMLQKGGSRQPIYVSNPRDPRIQAYQDSLNLSNYSTLQANKYFGQPNPDKYNSYDQREAIARLRFDRSIYNSLANSDSDIYGNKLSNLQKRTGYLPIGQRYLGEGSNYIFKKPVQQVIYKKPELEVIPTFLPPTNVEDGFEPPAIVEENTTSDYNIPDNFFEPSPIANEIPITTPIPEFVTTKRYDSKRGKWIEQPMILKDSKEAQYDKERWEWAKRNKKPLDNLSYTFQKGGDISIPDLNQYEDGGEYDLTQEEIDNLIAQGYIVEDVDTDQYKKGGTPRSLPKKKNSKAYSRSLTATNKLFAESDLTKKTKSRKNKFFDPTSKYLQDGGVPVDYTQFQNFFQTLPSNLQDPEYQYGNPDQYDLYGMWETVGKPQSFQNVQDSDYFPLQDDGTYSGFTVGSDGQFLKPMGHGTTWKEVMNAHLNTNPYFQQNRIIKNEQGRLQYVPNKQKGGTKTQYYTYGQSKNQYKKVGNKWYISNDVTDFKWQPIHDPTGNRAKELNKNAKVNPNPWVRPTNTFEGKLNAAMGDTQGQSARAAAFYARLGEDDVDNLRHADSGKRTQQAIAKATGSDLLGYYGSIGLGAAHELGTMFSDPRSWRDVLQEAYEDMENNARGARMGYYHTPNATKRLNYLSKTFAMPDGYGAVRPFPGSTWTDPYSQKQRLKAQQEVWNNPNPRPASLTEKFEKGGFQDDLGKHQKLLRDWTYGADIGMLHKAQNGKQVTVALPSGENKTYDVNSKEYKDLYESNNLANYNAEKDLYVMEDLPEAKVVGPKAAWAKYRDEFTNTTPWEKYLEKEKQKYLNRTNKGLNRMAGLSSKNFPKSEQERIRQRYDQKLNNYITRRLGKDFNFNPRKRGEWVEELSPKEREIVAGSSYGSKLQPSAWSDFLSGTRSIYNAVPDFLKPTFGDITTPIPGYTKAENRAALTNMLEGVNVAAPLDIPGIVTANYLKHSTPGIDRPSLGSGEYMADVNALDATMLNPFILGEIYELGPGLVRPAIKRIGTTADASKKLYNKLTTQTPLKNAYTINPFALKQNPEVVLHRVQKPGQTEEYITKHYGKETSPGWGRAFSSDPTDMLYYTNSNVRRQRGYLEDPEILRLKLPKNDIDQFNIYNFNEAQKSQGLGPYAFGSSKPTKEFVLPIQDIIKAEKFGINDLDQLMKEADAFNTPHWLRGYGYKKVPIKSSDQYLRSGIGGMDMSRYEIKNPDYFTQLLNTYDNKVLSPSNKKFYENLIASVKKQNGLVTERQYNELQRLKTGNFNFGKKGYGKGGYTKNAITTFQTGGPTYISTTNPKDQLGYDAAFDTITYNPNSKIENISNPWWKAHEDFHHKQNMEGRMSTYGSVGERPNPYAASDEAMETYYDRRSSDLDNEVNKMIQENPNLQFIPREKLYNSIPGFIGAAERMYKNPNTVEGEARLEEMKFRNKGGDINTSDYEELELTPEEIDWYIANGYDLELLD